MSDERQVQGVQKTPMRTVRLDWQAEGGSSVALLALQPRHDCSCGDASQWVLLAGGLVDQAQAVHVSLV